MNRDTFNLVVKILGLTIFIAGAGIIAIALVQILRTQPIEIPGVLENIAVAALAGMTGLLARSPGAEEVQPVEVVNAPLAVDDTGRTARAARRPDRPEVVTAQFNDDPE